MALTKSQSRQSQDTRQDFELSLREFIDGYRNQADRTSIVDALRTQAELLNHDYGWVGAEIADEDLDILDPAQNPLGARPAHPKATRADENTAPEPDSGAVQDRLAAKADIIGRGEEAQKTVPPSDRDAVAAKEGMIAAEAAHPPLLEQNPHAASHSEPKARSDQDQSDPATPITQKIAERSGGDTRRVGSSGLPSEPDQSRRKKKDEDD